MAQKNKKIDIKSTVKKSADSIKRMVNNGLSINRSYDCHYVLNEYWIAYLMSSFDKILQSTLFDLYRITNMIENCVDDVPEEIKNNISIGTITEEYDKQYMLNDEHDVFCIDNLKALIVIGLVMIGIRKAKDSTLNCWSCLLGLTMSVK